MEQEGCDGIIEDCFVCNSLYLTYQRRGEGEAQGEGRRTSRLKKNAEKTQQSKGGNLKQSEERSDQHSLSVM